MKGLFPASLVVASALLAVAESTIVLATGTAVGVSAAGLAAGALAVGGLLAGAGLVKLAARRRGKRQAPSCLPVENPEIYFSLAANGDFLDCGRRFVCELEATPEENLTQEEILIRDVFGLASVSLNGTGGTYYAEAGRIGSTDGVGACVSTFAKCPFDRKTIFRAFQDAKNTQ